ncbi:MAG: lysophospholipid acyltransferase family protein [Mycobacteriales bacterium]
MTNGRVAWRDHRGAGSWIWLCACIIWPIDHVLFKLRFRGFENIPRDGGVILAANHVSYADFALFVHYAWDGGRIPRVMAKDSLFRLPVAGAVLRGAKQIPVSRGTSTAHASLDRAVEALRRGESILIYPEGTITRDPHWWPMLGKTGVARLALASGVPVIPIAQFGAQRFYDRYHHRFRPFPRKRIDFVAGPPVDLSAYAGKQVTAEVLRGATTTIMTDVRTLLGEVRGEEPPADFAPQPGRVASDPSGGDR